MHIDLDLLFAFADRFGVPMLIFAVAAVLAYLFIKGPALVLARSLGEGFGSICKAGVEYLGEATIALRALPSHMTVESMATRETVKAEGAATREHVSAQIASVRERVSGVENEIGGQLRQATGSHPVLQAEPPTTKATS